MLDLLNAVLRGQHNRVQAILDTNPPQNHLNHALLNAATSGRLNMVRKLLNKGANINYKNTHSKLSALIHASIAGHTNIARELLNRGASRNGLALHYAIEFRQIPMIKLLILHGVPVNQRGLLLLSNQRIKNAIKEATKNLHRRQGSALVALGNVRHGTLNKNGKPRPSNRTRNLPNIPRPLIGRIMKRVFP
jgi:ankyrin repeat protein